MQKQIIVTGGLGFIGLSLIKKLITKNYYPIIIDNFSNVDFSLLKTLPKSKYCIIKENIINENKIKEKIKEFKPETLVHLAAIHHIPYCIKNQKETIKINVGGTKSVLNICSKLNIKNFIFISSGAVYKPSSKPCKEKDDLEPVDIYGISKKQGEEVTKIFCNNKKIKYTILRLFNVYGKNDLTPHFIPSILKSANESNRLKVGNIDTYRDYIYIEDAIDAIVKVILKGSDNSVYNIGTGKKYSGKEIIEIIKKISKKDLKIKRIKKLTRKKDRNILVADINKFSKKFSWKPKYSIHKGLKNMLNKITLGIVIDTALKIPPKTGVTYRLYFLSKKLSEKGINIKIFLCNRNIKNEKDAKNLFDKSSLEFHIIPENYFYNPQKLKQIISKSNLDIIQFEDPSSVIRFSDIAKDLKIPICLEMHDIETTLKKPFGYKDKEIKHTKKISQEACRIADSVICMTKLDFRELIKKIRVGKNKIDLVSNPIDLNYFPYYGPNLKNLNILFIGNMFYWPNKNAAKVIIKKIYPKIIKNTKDAKFYFIGMTPDNLKKNLKGHGITFTGPVDNLNRYLKMGTIAICPVLEGSGMKVKILNYCASGLPVITTKIGASGYDNIKSLIIENDINKYSNIILELFRSSNKISGLGKKNRNGIERYFDIEVLTEKIILIYKKTIKKHKENKTKGHKIKIPPLLWLKENRTKRIKNNDYYIIKNRKLSKEENLPNILIVEGFWQVGKSKLIKTLSENKDYCIIKEPDHLLRKINTDISEWYYKKHKQNLKTAMKQLKLGKKILMERSLISSVAYQYAKTKKITLNQKKDLEKINKIDKNLMIVFLYTDKDFIKSKVKNIKDEAIKKQIINNSNFYKNYLQFYKKVLPKYLNNRLLIIKINNKNRFINQKRIINTIKNSSPNIRGRILNKVKPPIIKQKIRKHLSAS